MTEINTICVFYSHGPHFGRTLKSLRKQFPTAHITALVPPEYPAEALEGLANRMLSTKHATYSMGHPRNILKLIGQIRRGKYDLFVVLFESPKLLLLASRSGARQKYCNTVDGRFFRLRGLLITHLLANLWHGICGRIRYRYIRWVIRTQPIEKK